MTEEIIAMSCSKLFEDGSARKVRVLAYFARHASTGQPKVLAEQSTPLHEEVMVSP